MTIRRITPVLVAAGLGAAALAGCGGSGSGSGSGSGGGAQPTAAHPMTLTMVTYLPTVSAGAASLLHHELAGFEAANPGIEVKLQTAAAATGIAVSSIVQQDEASGQTPDVVQTGMDALRYYVKGGLGAQDLTKVVGRRELDREWGGPHPYPAALRRLGQVDGVQVGIPWVLSTPVLFYNATLFKRAGLNPARGPRTWAQVAADALAIKRATGADGLSNGGVGVASGGVDWALQAIVGSSGGRLVSPDDNGPDFTNVGAVRAMTTMAGLGRSGAMVNISVKQTLEEFGQGKLAMVLQSSAAAQALLDSVDGRYTLGDVAMPSFDGRPTTPVNSGSALSILARETARQQASWKLIKYLTSDSAYTSITKQIGYPPLRTSLVADRRYLAGWARRQPLLPPNVSQLRRLHPWQDYAGSNYGQIQQVIENAAGQIAFDGADPAATLRKAQSQAEGMVN